MKTLSIDFFRVTMPQMKHGTPLFGAARAKSRPFGPKISALSVSLW